MTAYQCVLVLKFLSVLGFAGGTVAALVSSEPGARKWAVHRVASPCLLATWLSGYVLLLLNGWPLFELWIVGAVALSFAANGALAYVVARDRRGLGAALGVGAPIAGIVVLMVLKPTWAQVRP